MSVYARKRMALTKRLLPRVIAKLEKTIFKQPWQDVWAETIRFHHEQLKDFEKIKRCEADPKLKMSLCFRWCLWPLLLFIIYDSRIVKGCSCSHVNTYLGLSSNWANP